MVQEATVQKSRELELPPLGLGGTFHEPEAGKGIVLFAHGSGSSRFYPRNQHVASGLREAGLGTLLFDLLSEEESGDRRNVFDISLLANRLLAASEHVRSLKGMGEIPIGYFGASTGAGAALVAAANARFDVGAVVSRGGRPDLAGSRLHLVRAPTLLIVGSLDHEVIALNERAFTMITAEKRIEIVEGATHLFEQPGTLDQVILLARDWFATHLRDKR